MLNLLPANHPSPLGLDDYLERRKENKKAGGGRKANHLGMTVHLTKEIYKEVGIGMVASLCDCETVRARESARAKEREREWKRERKTERE